MSRKGRNGLEWLLEKEKPPQGADAGSAGAAVPENGHGAVSDVDAALAVLDLPMPSAAPNVISKGPAEASLALDADRESTPPPPRESGAAKSVRGADGLANALFQADPPAQKAEEPARVEGPAMVEEPAKVEPAKAEPAKAAPPAPKDNPAEEPESWQTARTGKLPGVRSKAEEIPAREVDEPPHEEASLEDDEPSAAFDASIAAEEPSIPPVSVNDPLAEVTERHKKAVSSGRSTRAHPRAKAVFDAKYKKANEPMTAKGRNVSLGGFFVETTRQLPEGEVFSAQLFFDQRKLSVIAEVMWVTMGDPDDLERFPPGMGCKFLDIDERDTPFLQGVIDASLSTGGAVP